MPSLSRTSRAFTVAALFGAAFGCAPRPPSGGSSGVYEITFNETRDSVTITAAQASRAAILEDLRVNHDIEVRGYDVPDERLSVEITNAPLHEALAAIMPPGSRYALRLGDRELVVPASPERPKRGGREEKPADAPTKDRTRPLAADQRLTVKGEPEPRRVVQLREGEGLKQRPSRSGDLPMVGSGQKRPSGVAVQDSTARLTFTISASGQVRLIDLRLVEGTAPPSRVVQGPLLYVLRDPNGSPLYFGALLDPLEVHSYLEDGTHSIDRAQEGTFGIWLPAEVVTPERLSDLVLEFYDAREVTLPTTLDEKSIERSAREAKPLDRLTGREILTGYRQGTAR